MPKAVIIATSSVESLLAAKLMEKAKIDYKAVHFDIGLTNDKPILAGQRVSKYGGMEHFIKNRVEIEKFDVAREFYSEVFSKSGYEGGPCLDHNVFVLRLAKQYMETQGCDFIVTGDVIGQCPITQSKEALARIDHEAGVEGLVFRPLSAALLPKTVAENLYHIAPSVILSYQNDEAAYCPILQKEFGLFGLPSPELQAAKKDLGCHEEDMGRKAFEIFEKGFTLNVAHLQRLGLHLNISEGAHAILGRTPFESTYLTLFYKKLKPQNATAFSLQSPRYTFGFIYGSDVTKEDSTMAARALASTVQPADAPKELSFFDRQFAFFGTKLVEPAPFPLYAGYINKDRSNEMSCPIFTTYSILSPD